MAVEQIEITEEDIRLGVPRNAQSCVIARAANRAFDQDAGCEYSDEVGSWYLQRGDKWYEVVGGAEIAKAFDRGRPVEPEVLPVREVPRPYDEYDEEVY